MVHFVVKETEFWEYVMAVGTLDKFLRDSDACKGTELNAWFFFEDAERMVRNKLSAVKTAYEYMMWCKSTEASELGERADDYIGVCEREKVDTLIVKCAKCLKSLISI